MALLVVDDSRPVKSPVLEEYNIAARTSPPGMEMIIGVGDVLTVSATALLIAGDLALFKFNDFGGSLLIFLEDLPTIWVAAQAFPYIGYYLDKKIHPEAHKITNIAKA
jgi:hypothetical protein